MVFNSMQYLVFLPIVLFLYYIIPNRIKNIWLLAASYFFYMCWNAKYALLILFSTMVTYASAIIIEKGKSKKIYIAVGIIANLMVLFWFKYFDFIFMNMAGVLGKLKVSLRHPAFDIVLPVGISFYTFQAIGYVMDVYRGEIRAEKNFIRYALFISFFPQLVAGPIERSKNLLMQFQMPKKFSVENIRYGLLTIAYGLFLKIVIADNIAGIVESVWGQYEYVRGDVLIIALMLFAIQIYCDFHGYTQIAMGSAKMLGIGLRENFNAPYLAGSVKEFWHRWHISLTSWFTDYLYIPLGGNRKGKFRKYWNTMIVFLASGLWHGAAWNYVVWGGLNGSLIILQDITKRVREKCFKMLKIDRSAYGWKVFTRIATFLLVDYTWLFFRSTSFKQAIKIQNRMISDFSIPYFFSGSIFDVFGSTRMFFILIVSLLVLLLIDYLYYKGIDWKKCILRQQMFFRWIVYAAIVAVILMYGAYGEGYEQTRFIYFQF